MQKMIHGNVNKNGTRKSGYDFKVSKVKTPGIYEITFSIPFPELPTVIVTQNYKDWNDFEYTDGSTLDNAVVIAVSEEKVKIKTGGKSGKATDRNFSFLAICEIPT